jgi:hypothetical protein
MANTVLTSKHRILGLPVKISEIDIDETIVATNADMGMLFVDQSVLDKEVLRDYSEIDSDNLPEGMPISVYYIEDYKSTKIDELKCQIEEFENI